MAPTTTAGPFYSARLLVPFVRLLERRSDLPVALRSNFKALDPDERVPVQTAHELLAGAVALTNDPDLGLRAAREVSLGDYGAVEYAARSAATWGDACVIVGRYMRLINEALHYSVRSESGRAFIQLQNSVPLPRAAADFQSGAFIVSASNLWPHGEAPQYEAWFTHERPSQTDEYARTFPGAELRFAAPFNGFVLDKHYLDAAVTGADPKLHALIRNHADALLASLPQVQSTTAQIRELITSELAGGDPSVNHIARKVRMGARTLARRLEQEGTTFRDVLDDLRRRLALGYVAGSDLGLSEIAFLLGYSQAAAFHRAFKRWTTQTPLEYRQKHNATSRHD